MNNRSEPLLHFYDLWARDRRVQVIQWARGSGDVVYENESRLW